jgi:hypothetical protein
MKEFVGTSTLCPDTLLFLTGGRSTIGMGTGRMLLNCGSNKMQCKKNTLLREAPADDQPSLGAGAFCSICACFSSMYAQ